MKVRENNKNKPKATRNGPTLPAYDLDYLQELFQNAMAVQANLEHVLAAMRAMLAAQDPENLQHIEEVLHTLTQGYASYMEVPQNSIPFVKRNLETNIGEQVRIFQCIHAAVEVFTMCYNIYNNFSNMSSEEKRYAYGSMFLMLAGTALLIASIAQPQIAPICMPIGYALVNAGYVLGHEANKRFATPESKKNAQSLKSALKSLYDFVTSEKTRKNMNYAYDAFQAMFDPTANPASAAGNAPRKRFA